MNGFNNHLKHLLKSSFIQVNSNSNKDILKQDVMLCIEYHVLLRFFECYAISWILCLIYVKILKKFHVWMHLQYIGWNENINISIKIKLTKYVKYILLRWIYIFFNVLGGRIFFFVWILLMTFFYSLWETVCILDQIMLL